MMTAEWIPGTEEHHLAGDGDPPRESPGKTGRGIHADGDLWTA